MKDEIIINNKLIESKIYTIRGVQVMLDSDLAVLYEVETKRLNEQVKRNIRRFPEYYMFQLSLSEWDLLKSQIATGSDWSQIATSQKHRKTEPFAFTEQGVAMLSSVLHSQTAINASIQIIDAFVKMRKHLLESSVVNNRLDRIEIKILENEQKIEQVFKALENRDVIPSQGLFFDGQLFDAYELASRIIRSATKSIVLIDNYIDENTLVHLCKKQVGVKVQLLTKNISKELKLDVKKAAEQFGDIHLSLFSKSHDRFLIIDSTEIYHLGASLKDLGKKWFAFSKLDPSSVASILTEIEN